MYEQSIASALPEETDRAARAALARLAKREGDIARAHQLWESALGNSREGYEAYEQLAIHYEHEAREPRRAMALAREPLVQLRRANQMEMITSAEFRRTKARFEHRLCSTQLTLSFARILSVHGMSDLAQSRTLAVS